MNEETSSHLDVEEGLRRRQGISVFRLTHLFGAAALAVVLAGVAYIEWFNGSDAFYTSLYCSQISIGIMACGFICALAATFRRRPAALLAWLCWGIAWIILLPPCVYA